MNNSSRRKFIRNAAGLVATGLVGNSAISNATRSVGSAGAYGNLHMTSQTFAAIEAGKGLDVCRDCGEFVAQCMNNVQIADRLDDLKMLMA